MSTKAREHKNILSQSYSARLVKGIKAYMKINRIGSKEASSAIGCGYSTLGGWLQGRKKVPSSRMKDIERFLGVKVETEPAPTPTPTVTPDESIPEAPEPTGEEPTGGRSDAELPMEPTAERVPVTALVPSNVGSFLDLERLNPTAFNALKLIADQLTESAQIKTNLIGMLTKFNTNGDESIVNVSRDTLNAWAKSKNLKMNQEGADALAYAEKNYNTNAQILADAFGVNKATIYSRRADYERYYNYKRPTRLQRTH